MASNTVIQTNVLALNSHRNLGMVGVKKEKASQRLSSGYRINSAADDAAGLAISEKMRAQIRGLDMASKNTQDGISLIQTAEGGMQEIDNMLQRIRELVNQASNDTNEHNEFGTGDRQKMQDEIDQLIEAIDQMAGQVEFNKKRLIDGSYMDTASELIRVANKIVEYGDSTIATSIIGKKFTELMGANDPTDLTTAAFGDYNTIAKLQALVDSGSAGIDAEIDKIVTLLQDPATGTSAERTIMQDILKMFRGIKPTVQGLESAEALHTKLQTIPAAEGLWFQTGANANQGITVSIGSIKTDVLGIGDGEGGSTTIDVLHATGADITAQLDLLDEALSYVTTERSKLGAYQNRLEFTNNSLQVSSENLSAAESRIRDTDMAKEMMNLSKANVLQQAAISMLAQANQQPQSILQLLQ